MSNDREILIAYEMDKLKDVAIKYRRKIAEQNVDEYLKKFNNSYKKERELLNWMSSEPNFNIDDIDEIIDDYKFYKENKCKNEK